MHFCIEEKPTRLERGDQFVINLTYRRITFSRGNRVLTIDGHLHFGLPTEFEWTFSACQCFVLLIRTLTGASVKCIDRTNDCETYELEGS